MIFPHLAGHIPGFGKQPETFDQYQKHHVLDKETGRSYDLTVYNIIKYFMLTSEGNPNMIDSLFIPRRCITKASSIYEHVRENRRLFLSRKVFYTFRGYANSQLAKLDVGRNRSNPKRDQSIKQFGYDTKFAYHLVRLMEECEQILMTGDLILDRDGGMYRSIRNGEWSLEKIKDWFEMKERVLTSILPEAVVPEKVDMEALRRLLIDCLEMHYGHLTEVVYDNTLADRILDALDEVRTRFGGYK